MKKRAAKLYHWAIEKASSSKAPLWLALLFSLEIVLFVPLDALLMFFCLQKRSHIFLYVLIASIASALSGVIGYLIGHFLWDLVGGWVVPHLISWASFSKVSTYFQQTESWAVFITSLLPFPLKALSIVAGVFHLGLFKFITFLTFARCIRFGLIGACMAMWGEKVKAFVDRNFHRIFMLFGAKLAAVVFFLWILAR